MWDCHHSCFTVPEGAAVRRALWVAAGGGKEMWWVDGGQNHKCGVSHGQTEKIYDWSGSTSAAWCWSFRMPGMGVRSDSGFSLYTLSGICSLVWLAEGSLMWGTVCGLFIVWSSWLYRLTCFWICSRNKKKTHTENDAENWYRIQFGGQKAAYSVKLI